MAGYKPTFGENLNFAYQGSGARGRDLASTLQSGMAGLGNLRNMAAAAKDAQKQLSNLKQRASDLEAIRAKTAPASKAFAELTYRINETNQALEKTKKSARSMGLDMFEKSLGGLTKKLLSFNTSLLSLGFDFLISSITRVYELQEKWTKAIGGFNMKLGGMTSGLSKATKAAGQWSSTMRGLTNGDIQEGIEMFGDFTLAVGKVGTALNFQKWGIEAARGFGLGAEGAGQLAKVLNNIGESGDDATKLFGHTLVSAAQAADVPITMLAKDIQESSTYLARFGKEGAKTFVQGAAYARKFTISMKQLQGAVEGFDMFDDAAKTASKLNTAFGTMVNSMDLMMEDDPAKRLEMIRQQFLAQGKTFDTLAPKQRRYLAETLKLTEDQVGALLDVKNANVSYTDFKAKEAAKEKQEVDAKRNMEIMLRKTTQTMYAFGAAFDRITLAIANAIQPLLKVFGLATTGDKKFKNFGEVMESVTKTVEQFFNSLNDGSAGAQKWQGFMQTLADDIVRAGKALKDFVMSGRAAELVGELADSMKSFYVWVRDLGIKALPYIDKIGHAFLFLAKNVKYFAYAWAGVKGISMLGGAGGMMGGLGKIASGGRGLLGAANASVSGQGGLSMGSRLGSAGMGLALGGMVGGPGAQIGGAIGGLAGPLGAMLGVVIGKSINHLVDYFTKDDAAEERAADLAEAQGKLTASAQRLSIFQEKSALVLKRSDMERAHGDQALLQLQQGKQLYEVQDKQALIDRVKQLQGFGKHASLSAQALEHLTTDGRLSKDMLKALGEASSAYNSQLTTLESQTKEYIQLQTTKLGLDNDEFKIAMLKNRASAADLALKEQQREGDELHKKLDAMGTKGFVSPEGVALQKQIIAKRNQIEATKDQQNQIAIAIAKQQSKTLDKQYILQLKQFELESLSRDTEFMKFAEVMRSMPGMADASTNMLARGFLAQNSRARGEMQAMLGDQYGTVVAQASGGVITRPTHALIGEAGPEAVIPLRSLARGRMGVPARQGGQAASNMLNYASGGGQSGGQVVSSTAEITLDGHKVGRALVRTLITSR